MRIISRDILMEGAFEKPVLLQILFAGWTICPFLALVMAFFKKVVPDG